MAGVDHGKVAEPERGSKELLGSSAGRSWVNVIRIPTGRGGYSIILEAEGSALGSQLPQDRRAWRSGAGGPDDPGLSAPRRRLDLGGFDWDWLLHLWADQLEFSGKPWVRNAADPRAAHDRAAQDWIRILGAPRHLGTGYGHARTKITGACMFGARYTLDTDATLREVVEDLTSTTALAAGMADYTRWTP